MGKRYVENIGDNVCEKCERAWEKAWKVHLKAQKLVEQAQRRADAKCNSYHKGKYR